MKKPPFGGFLYPRRFLFSSETNREVRGWKIRYYMSVLKRLVEGRCVKERPSGACQMNHWRLLMAIEAYCVKCKAKKEMQDPLRAYQKR